jgi:hypothetical protein
MFNSRQKDLAAFGIFFAFCAVTCLGQTMSVKIVKRQDGETAYNYSTAGRSDSTTETRTKCRDGYSGTKCTETTSTSTAFVPPVQGTYSVTGSTLSLLLPDGRVAVVNCTSKLSLFSPGPQTQRSCRIPPQDNIQAEFKGKNAKLSWPVSIDGSKFDSETYKILTVSN